MRIIKNSRDLITLSRDLWRRNPSPDTVARVTDFTRGDLALLVLLKLIPTLIVTLIIVNSPQIMVALGHGAPIAKSVFAIGFVLGFGVIWALQYYLGPLLFRLLYVLAGKPLNGAQGRTLFATFSLIELPVLPLIALSALLGRLYPNTSIYASFVYVANLPILYLYAQTVKRYRQIKGWQTLLALLLYPMIFFGCIGFVQGLKTPDLESKAHIARMLKDKNYTAAQQETEQRIDEEIADGKIAAAVYDSQLLAQIQDERLKQPVQAEHTLRQALKLLDGDTTKESATLQAQLYRGIALIFDAQNKHAETRENFALALDAAKVGDDEDLLATLLIDAGIEAAHVKEYSRAMEYYNEALSHQDQTSEANKLQVYNNMAWEMTERGDFKNARIYGDKGMALVKRIPDDETVPALQDTMAVIELHDGNNAAALALSEKSLTVPTIPAHTASRLVTHAHALARNEQMDKACPELAKAIGLYQSVGEADDDIAKAQAVQHEVGCAP